MMQLNLAPKKKCSKCGVARPLGQFYKAKCHTDGLQSACKICNKIYAQVDKVAYAERNKQWKLKNKERISEYNYNYNVVVGRDKDVKRESDRKYQNQRYASDPNYKLRSILRARMGVAIRGQFRSGSAVRDLGCSIAELKLYIEAKFRSGMSWANWNPTGWHLDHIIPLAAFDLTNVDEFKKAAHYTNLQPLWRHENLMKLDKVA